MEKDANISNVENEALKSENKLLKEEVESLKERLSSCSKLWSESQQQYYDLKESFKNVAAIATKLSK